MKTKKYRLETVLGVRSRARDEAARQVALRLNELETAEKELARRVEKLQSCVEKQNKAQAQLDDEINRGIQARDIVAHQSYLNDLKTQEKELRTEVENQRKTVKKAEISLAAARENLAESARELKSIETHRANWQTEREKEDKRRKQKISDEIAAILHAGRDGK